MSRIVLTGTPTTLYRPRARDLPADRDLSFSHFEYVDASGLDLSAYNLSYTDWWWCNCDGVRLPVGGTAWLLSRETSWTGAIPPADLRANAISHDLLIEAYRQGLALMPARDQPVGNTILNYLSRNYTACLSDGVKYALSQGYTAADLRALVQDSPLLRPDLDDQLNKQTAPGGLVDFKAGRAALPNGLDFDDGSPLSIAPAIRRDRWRLARALEALLEKLYGEPWRVLVKQVAPFPLIEAGLKNLTGSFL